MDSRPRSAPALQYSGVVVRIRKDRFEDACRQIDALPDVEVRLRHPDGEQLIAVVETESADDQAARLRQVQNVDGVLVAAPVFHYIDDPASEGEPSTSRPL